MPQEIAKENQQYRICLQYEYIGSNEMGNKIQKRDLEEFNKLLPMGYTAESDSNSWSWGEKDNRQYLLLLVVIAIIFFTTSVLFNSLKQPLAIIFVIPVSSIGVSLTFYWFRLNFDQGGFASFVLQCGSRLMPALFPELVQQHPTSFPPSFRSSCLRQGVECEGRSYFPHGSFYHSGIYPFHDR